MTEKVTTMVLKGVDLKCPSCYKKIKKLLCKYPQIRNQVFDEKQNTVTITVVCCNPEKIRDKLCCKGGKTIKSIEIVKPPPPKPPEKKKEPEKPEAEKPKEAEKSKEAEKPKEAAKPKQADAPKPKDEDGPSSPPSPSMPLMAMPHPVRTCYGPSYNGYGGGPCYHGYARPVPWYDNYGHGPYCGWGGYRGGYVSRCDYFGDENARGCTIM